MNMSKNIEIEYLWTKELFLQASRATYEFELRHSPKRFLGWFFIIMTQFGVVGALKKDAYGLLLVSSVLVVYWYFFRWRIRKLLISKTYNNSTAKETQFSMQAKKDGLSVNGTLLRWKEITEAVSLKEGFLLYYGDTFLYIPKSAFKSVEQKDLFSHLAKDHVNNYRKEY